jgi:hypothetical protein
MRRGGAQTEKAVVKHFGFAFCPRHILESRSISKSQVNTERRTDRGNGWLHNFTSKGDGSFDTFGSAIPRTRGGTLGERRLIRVMSLWVSARFMNSPPRRAIETTLIQTAPFVAFQTFAGANH